MKTDEKTLKTVSSLLEKLWTLEGASDIISNYDSHVYLYFTTSHNHNKGSGKSEKIELSGPLKDEAIFYVTNQIDKIKGELEKI